MRIFRDKQYETEPMYYIYIGFFSSGSMFLSHATDPRYNTWRAKDIKIVTMDVSGGVFQIGELTPSSMNYNVCFRAVSKSVWKRLASQYNYYAEFAREMAKHRIVRAWRRHFQAKQNIYLNK